MNYRNYNNIRAIFENKTGVILPARKSFNPAVAAGIVAAAAACITVTAVAISGAAALKGHHISL